MPPLNSNADEAVPNHPVPRASRRPLLGGIVAETRKTIHLRRTAP